MTTYQDNIILLAFNESPCPQLITRNRMIVECNHAFARMFGYAREELVGASIRLLYPSTADYDLIGQRCLESLRHNVYYEDERFMQHKSGMIFWTRSRGITLSPSHPFELVVWNFERMHEDVVKATELTQREREVSALVVNGLTSKQIAAELGVSFRTVEAHRARLMKKLGAHNTADLVSKIIMVQYR